ncbi:MAG: hypothetical protein JSS75_02485 [Bacteroidetes bacterium]|nr:hypothetical protein [Bacteroidota bacterium]
MKRSYLLALSALLLCSGAAIAQDLGGGVSAVGSNFLRIGSGDQDNNVGGSTSKRYFEEIANARIFFSNLSIGLRYEMDDPSEVGQSFQGLRRRWIAYKKDGLDVEAGHITSLWGRGLSINNFESRPLNYDAWLDGFNGKYEYRWTQQESELRPSLGVKAMAGNVLFHDIDTTKPDQSVSARAVNTEFGLFSKKVVVGLSFVQAFTSIQQTVFTRTAYTNSEVNQPELYVSFLQGPVSGFFGFAEERSHLTEILGKDVAVDHRGKAMYGSLSYAGDDFGITAEYKNYSYFVHSQNDPYADYFGKLPITSPPEVYKDFSYQSITRTTHAVNFNDELGYQIEADITAIPSYTITLNASASSRHNSYSSKLDSNGEPLIAGSTDILPKFDDNGFFPFWEYFAEVEHDFGDLSYVKMWFHRRSDVLAASGQTADRKRSSSVGLKMQYETTPSQSILFALEHQWMFDSQRDENDHQLTNELAFIQYSFNPIITFGFTFDFSTWYEAGRHIWPEAVVSYRIGGAHTLLLTYGAERGGLNCSGGVCRYVPAFNGLRVSLTSQL